MKRAVFHRGETDDEYVLTRRLMIALALTGVMTVAAPPSATAQAVAPTNGNGTAIVRVVTDPDFGGGTFGFDGEPAGELTLVAGEPRSLVADDLMPGDRSSTLVEIDPAVVAAGYQLTGIACDDVDSERPSTGNIDQRNATFRVEDGEIVTCVFKLSAGGCLCPKEGRWKVANHTGSMVCTGTMSMTVPLPANASTGMLEHRDGCATVIGSGMSEDEATVEMRLQDDCSYRGSVGGTYQEIPMVIDFTWRVVNDEKVIGDLHSEVTQQGMTCVMTRTYELDYSGP